jgi:hypothetical protein
MSDSQTNDKQADDGVLQPIVESLSVCRRELLDSAARLDAGLTQAALRIHDALRLLGPADESTLRAVGAKFGVKVTARHLAQPELLVAWAVLPGKAYRNQRTALGQHQIDSPKSGLWARR